MQVSCVEQSGRGEMDEGGFIKETRSNETQVRVITVTARYYKWRREEEVY